MPDCLYCQQPAPPKLQDCPHCGMPLPLAAERHRLRRLRHFQWFCAGLALFCAIMVYWLPRSLN
ncbi:MAG TPA: hypothetical protein VEA17_10500 [Bordetella sp.]|nr:hypothetical protein [Bordetella sp.]